MPARRSSRRLRAPVRSRAGSPIGGSPRHCAASANCTRKFDRTVLSGRLESSSPRDIVSHLFLFIAALVGGLLNAVAGGGSFIGLPALIYVGVPPVAANATTTLAMWPGSAASAV